MTGTRRTHPGHFDLAGEAWSNLHVLFLLSAVGRLASALLSLRLHDPGARGNVRELVRPLTDRTGFGVVRLTSPPAPA